MRNNNHAIFGAHANRNNFLPSSRYYGDRYARTMEEAFGPGAKLDVITDDDVDAAVQILVRAIISVAVAICFIGWVVWAMTP